MRLVTVSVVFLSILSLAHAHSSGTTATAPPQDPQAVSVLTQALAAAGGASAVSGVLDYTATGNITYYGAEQLQGTVTVLGLISLGDIRVDATLPTGVRSWVVDNGIVSTKTEAGLLASFAPSNNVPSSDAFPYSTPLFPSSLIFPTLPLNTFLTSQAFSIFYNGVTQIDGHSVHDILVQRSLSGAVDTSISSQSRELFVDTTTFQIIMARDTLPKNVLHEVHYSNHQAVNGVLMPFTITEVIDSQQISSIQLNKIAFNSGLQSSGFTL